MTADNSHAVPSYAMTWQFLFIVFFQTREKVVNKKKYTVNLSLRGHFIYYTILFPQPSFALVPACYAVGYRQTGASRAESPRSHGESVARHPADAAGRETGGQEGV